ncbi:FoF1 ATP synthase subunit delta/epsilon [Catenisphaera adipataccumulans]|nr:F0F1 ATP synthase subunit epsilon [Catenisphaera adipataccumulans]
MKPFDLKVLASDHVFYDDQAVCLTVQTPNGSTQYLADHAAVISAVLPGELRIRKPDDSELEVVCGLGTVMFSENSAKVTVDTCETQEQLDRRRAREAYDRARERLRQKQSIEEYKLSQAAMARALARLQFKGKDIH